MKRAHVDEYHEARHAHLLEGKLDVRASPRNLRGTTTRAPQRCHSLAPPATRHLIRGSPRSSRTWTPEGEKKSDDASHLRRTGKEGEDDCRTTHHPLCWPSPNHSALPDFRSQGEVLSRPPAFVPATHDVPSIESKILSLESPCTLRQSFCWYRSSLHEIEDFRTAITTALTGRTFPPCLGAADSVAFKPRRCSRNTHFYDMAYKLPNRRPLPSTGS
ncbi:hypothetical protein DENSPDRAFT_689634 [Dentipellis sp. KUC8613]|nr:hypothetical protein DENSPDRAFT_689634 [Dentipellis sp. KUC8613]